MERGESGFIDESRPSCLFLEQPVADPRGIRGRMRVLAVPDQDEISIHRGFFTYTTMIGV
jgi:hypothetical protein